MPIVSWIARDEEGRIIEVQAEIVPAENFPELVEPEPDPEEEPE